MDSGQSHLYQTLVILAGHARIGHTMVIRQLRPQGMRKRLATMQDRTRSSGSTGCF